MNELLSLGFSESEIFPVVLDRECRPFVPVKWYDDDGYFAIRTSTRLDVSLNTVGLRSGRLPLIRDRETFAVHEMEESTFLGMTRPLGEVTVFESSAEGNVFGALGATFFQNAVLAFDPAGPIVAASRQVAPIALRESGFHALSHVGHSGLPITSQIHVKGINNDSVTILDTGSAGSQFSIECSASKLKRTRAGMRVDILVSKEIPDTGISVTLAEPEPRAEYAVELGTGPIDFTLGMSFLRKSLTVFDFRNGLTYIRPYQRPSNIG